MSVKEPPMLVMMDILALFLFVFMLNRPPSFGILFADNESLPSDCYTAHNDNGTWIVTTDKGEEPIGRFLQEMFVFRVPCDGEHCAKGDSVLVTGKSARKALKKFVDLCFSDQHQCNVAVTLHQNGSVSIDSIEDSAP